MAGPKLGRQAFCRRIREWAGKLLGLGRSDKGLWGSSSLPSNSDQCDRLNKFWQAVVALLAADKTRSSYGHLPRPSCYLSVRAWLYYEGSI